MFTFVSAAPVISGLILIYLTHSTYMYLFFMILSPSRITTSECMMTFTCLSRGITQQTQDADQTLA